MRVATRIAFSLLTLAATLMLSACFVQQSGPTAGNGCDPSGGVSFSDSDSHDTNGQTTVDGDGSDYPSPITHQLDPTGQPQVSWSVNLGSLRTNFIALNPGWAAANKIKLGDVATVTHKGKTVFAVYADNHVGDEPHAEVSARVISEVTGTPISNVAALMNSITGVDFHVYPGSGDQLGETGDQAKIDEVGKALSGGGSGSGSTGCGGSAEVDGSDNMPGDYTGGFSAGNCTAFASWKVKSTTKYTDFQDNWTHNGKTVHFGDAKDWPAAAAKVGIQVDQTPAPGSIAWNSHTGSQGWHGHVAYVTKVNSNGTIDVAEYNWSNSLAYGERKNIDWKADPDGNGFRGFIHFER